MSNNSSLVYSKEYIDDESHIEKITMFGFNMCIICLLFSLSSVFLVSEFCCGKKKYKNTLYRVQLKD